MGLLHEAATQLAFPHHLLLSKHFAVRSWNIWFLLGAHSVGSVVTWLLFLVCRQGRHVKTGQLAAIKVMEVTEVKVPCKHSVCVSLLSVCSPLLSLIFCVFINLPLSWHSQLVHTSKYSRFILFLPFIFCFSVIFWGYSFKMSILQSINPDSGNYLLLFILKVIFSWLFYDFYFIAGSTNQRDFRPFLIPFIQFANVSVSAFQGRKRIFQKGPDNVMLC